MNATGMSERIGHLFKRRMRTPLVLQSDATECGAACLASVLRHHGNWVTLEEMREVCGAGRDGCSAADISRAARQYHLEATGWRQEPEDLPKLPLPAILHWEFRHFVVLEGVGDGQYFLNDPARGRRVVDEKAFDQSFTGVALEFHPTASFRRSQPPPGVLRQLWPWMSGFRTSLLYAVFAGLLLAVPGVAAPVLLALFVEDVLVGGQKNWGAVLVGAMAAAGVAVYVLTWLRQRSLRRLAIAVAIRQSDRFIGRLLHRSAQFFTRRLIGDLLSRVQSIEQVVAVGVHRLVSLTVDLVMGLAFLSLMIVYDAALAAIVFIIAVACAIASRITNRHWNDESIGFRKEQGSLAGSGFAGLHATETLRATASEDDYFVHWSGILARELNARQRFREFGLLAETVPILFIGLGGAAVLGIGGSKVMSEELPLGSLIAFYILAWNFLQPIGRFVQFAELLRTLEAELPRLDEILHGPDVQTEPGARTGPRLVTASGRLRLRGQIEIRDLRFGYQHNQPPLIEGFDIVVQPGQRIAIVGPSGSGKSTLSLLVAGILHPWSGEILFDGMHREQVPRDVLNDSVSVVTQDSALFEGTLRENLTLWDPNVPDPQLIAAARDSGIHDEIVARPNGFDSEVSETGRNFSAGQRQQLEIARALVPDPSLLVLDEATAALDANTENEIYDALRRRGCTCLIVAHRPSAIIDCDRIIVLDAGRVVQDGRHDDLVADRNGLYRNLMHDS